MGGILGPRFQPQLIIRTTNYRDAHRWVVGKRLECRWEISYKGGTGCVGPRPEWLLPNRSDLILVHTNDRTSEEDFRRLAQDLQDATADEFAQMVRLLRSKPDGQVLGQAEFEARDLAHKIAAEVVQAEVNDRQNRATRAPV